MKNHRAALYDVKLFFFNMVRTNTNRVENVNGKVNKFRELCQNLLSLLKRPLLVCIFNLSFIIIPVYALTTVMQKMMHGIKSIFIL